CRLIEWVETFTGIVMCWGYLSGSSFLLKSERRNECVGTRVCLVVQFVGYWQILSGNTQARLKVLILESRVVGEYQTESSKRRKVYTRLNPPICTAGSLANQPATSSSS